jgi:integrase/recombinase XerD
MDSRKWIDRYSVDCKLKYPSKATQENYISGVTIFLNHFKNEEEPKAISTDKIKQWLLSCKNENSRNHKLCAVKSFYQLTVGMPAKIDKIPYSRKAQSLPMPLSLEEIKLLIKSCENKKHKAIIYLLFGCGMRVGEVLNLKPEHIDRARKVIHVVNGKGLKDRFVPLDNCVLTTLEDYWREYRPIKWMFNGQYSIKEHPTQYTDRSINQFIKDIGIKAGLTKRLYSHLGRHSYASLLVENGTDLGIIQNILGHKRQATTLIYAKITSATVNKISSPLAFL